MTADEKPAPRRNLAGEQRERERQERLARALRENLGRRKAQQRARDADPRPASSTGGGD